jgi:very-short-patch-repair endonuclease
MNLKLKNDLIEVINKSPNTYARYLKKSHPKLFQFIDQYPGDTVPEKSYNAINDLITNEYFCKECNKLIDKPFITFMKGYRLFCCNSCSSKGNIKANGSKLNTEEGKLKRKEALINKYGTDSMITVNRKKAIETTQKTLGVDYPLQSSIIRYKIKENLLAEHGVINVFQLPEIIEKIQQTMLTNHGASHPLQCPDILEKQQATMFDRFGVDNAFKSEIIRDNIKLTNLEKYGAENPMQSSVIREKAKLTSIENNGVDNPMLAQTISEYSGQRQREESVKRGEFSDRLKKFKDIFLVEPLFTAQDFIDGKPTIWKHVCGTHYESGWGNGMLTVCPKPECRKQSAPQRSIYEYVRSIVDCEIKVNTREIISPYELDIYLPDKKIAIEMDGIYWHQNEKEKLDKQILCRELGIQLIHITDLSWYSRTDIWKSILASKLKVQERIYARSCSMNLVSLNEVKQFLQEHHFQGSVNHKVAVGLFIDEKPVAVMTFGAPRFNEKYKWELLRYASIKNLTVVGGASRLLKFFRTLNLGSIITYAKKEYSNGNLYQKLGFTLIDQGSKSYFYMKGDITISRYQAQKHKLPKLLGDKFNTNLSEKENMKQAGYILIPDRGSITFGLD